MPRKKPTATDPVILLRQAEIDIRKIGAARLKAGDAAEIAARLRSIRLLARRLEEHYRVIARSDEIRRKGKGVGTDLI